MRPTITAYYKHLIETTHRETVKKLCDENKYQPSIYDQVIHLAFANNVSICLSSMNRMTLSSRLTDKHMESRYQSRQRIYIFAFLF